MTWLDLRFVTAAICVALLAAASPGTFAGMTDDEASGTNQFQASWCDPEDPADPDCDAWGAGSSATSPPEETPPV